MNLHQHYDQLTHDERAALDAAFRDMMRALAASPYGGARIIGDDRAERAIDACARAVIESRDEGAKFAAIMEGARAAIEKATKGT